jgi:hypothetical protein
MVASLACVLAAVPAKATAPPGRYKLSGGTVKDNRTGLLWQQAVDPGTYTQAAGITYCSNLNLGGFSSGWRLPTVQELLSIVDVTVANQAIDANAFPNTPGNYFWTSSAYVGSSGNAWVVHFGVGASDVFATSNAYPVRCVR